VRVGHKRGIPKAILRKENAQARPDGLNSDSLDAPLEFLLASGIDSRLKINPIDGLNGYGCQPGPRPDVFTFASSTATTVSNRGFASAGLELEQLVQASKKRGIGSACDLFAEKLRKKIRSLLEVPADQAEIIFSPSGTDSQVHALYVAQARLGSPLVSVIVASDETGSGTSYATTGRHFSTCTATGVTVSKGKRMDGFAEDTESIQIPLRDTNGTLRSRAAIDSEVIASVSDTVASGKRVLLHVMDTSKFGSRCPSVDCLSRIQVRWGESVQVVVDACQMRVGRGRLKYYLQQGFMVLITGSKFFTGPPLSGALLVPAAASAVMARTTHVPTELQNYTSETDWPIAWQGVRSKLPARPNVGQLLRWAAAVEEMRAYYAVPPGYRMLALRTFSLQVSRLIASRPELHSLKTLQESAEHDIDDEEMAVRTIFPFFLRRRGKLLSVEECARVYRALNCDVSALLPDSATERQRQIAARCCHIGQPMAMRDPLQGEAGTLRISAGARVVSDSWSVAGVAALLLKVGEELGQVRTILEKITILVENFDSLGSLDNTGDLSLQRSERFSGISSGAEPNKIRAGSLSLPRHAAHTAPVFVGSSHQHSAGDRK
jgi:hypothetical protein